MKKILFLFACLCFTQSIYADPCLDNCQLGYEQCLGKCTSDAPASCKRDCFDIGFMHCRELCNAPIKTD